MEIKKQITGMRRFLNDSTGRIYQRVGKEGEKLKEEPQDLDSVWPPHLNSTAEAPQSLQPPSRGAWNELPPSSGQFSGQYGTRSRTFQSQPHTTGSSNGELPAVNPSGGANCCTCNCQSTLQAILQELRTMRKLMQIQAAGAQNRQQPPISLICAQRTAVSRKRNKKKKVPSKTVEPLPVKQKAGALGPEKTAVASEQSGPPAAEHPCPGDSRVLGFGIVLESPASDKCNLLKALMCSCLSHSWILSCQTTLAQEAFCLESWCARFSTTRRWLTPYPTGRGKEDSMTTGKD
ncbi:BEN domain-containing protein 7 isoform X8 [Suricata suricatta]|uniref:BEN domain-containing protein 7 isoform X8 n=1 Tax=Suricata suricatta TaxID=37032 RepID=UPI001155BA14|nr:BEN domain-containing protein 7 isoform X8 [Suricata suricatta]